MWQLVHTIKGLGDHYETCFEQSGLIVQ